MMVVVVRENREGSGDGLCGGRDPTELQLRLNEHQSRSMLQLNSLKQGPLGADHLSGRKSERAMKELPSYCAKSINRTLKITSSIVIPHDDVKQPYSRLK